MISSGLTSPSVSILIPPLFRELRADTLANPGGSVVCLSAIVSLAIGTEPPVSVELGPIPVLQLPLLSPTVVALFSEPNFGLTEDASVVLLVPKHSPFSSAAPLFKELQKIEGILDSLRSIASIATFLLGLSEVIALSEQPRLRFVSANGVPKLGEIKIKHKPWYNFFGDDPNFDDATNSLLVFGVPGTKVTFFNDTFFKHAPQSNQGYYTVELFDLNHLTQHPDPNSPLPDFFVAIRSYPTKAEVQLDSNLSDHKSPPPTAPAGRILDWSKDGGDDLWYTDMSSVRFHQDFLDAVSAEVKSPKIIGTLTCQGRKHASPVPAASAS